MVKKTLALLLTCGSVYAYNSPDASLVDINDSFIGTSHIVDKIDNESFIMLPEKHSKRFQDVVDSETFDIAKHAPVISSDETIRLVTVNPNFVANMDVYGDMIDLSYHIAKKRDDLTKLIQQNLSNEGWEIKIFEGFSGLSKKTKILGQETEPAHRDLQGFVAFNKVTGEAIVSFHGSQDKWDWENNFDGQKVIAQEDGLKFRGSVHRGINYRYQSSKAAIYKILNNLYDQLENKDLFHITTVGHSLGGGMASLAAADLATDYAKVRFGEKYNNKVHNRVRAFPVSAPRVFDSVAVEDLTHFVGTANIILDGVVGDPVTTSGPGKSVTKWLEQSSRYGLTAGLLKVINCFKEITPHTNPQALAYTHGDYMHLGLKALTSWHEVNKIKLRLDQEDLEKVQQDSPTKKVGFFGTIAKKIKSYFSDVHYGRTTSLGTGFEKGFVVGTTLEQRLNDNQKVKSVSAPISNVSTKTSWWNKVKGFVTNN